MSPFAVYDATFAFGWTRSAVSGCFVVENCGV